MRKFSLFTFLSAMIVSLFSGFETADAQFTLSSQVITIDFSTVPEEITVTQADADEFEGFAPCVGQTINLHEFFIEAQEVFNQRIIGYRSDIPRLLRQQLRGARISVAFDDCDGVGGTLAFAGPEDTLDFNAVSGNVFHLQRGVRSWSFTTVGAMTIDINDICLMAQAEIFTDVIVHEAMHAIGFGTLFEANSFNGATNLFGQRNFTFNGFTLPRYRIDAQIPFATFIPLNQQDGGGHWDPNDPFFNQVQNGIRDVMHPEAPPEGVESVISNPTWAMFADLGYIVRGVNAPLLPNQ